MSPTARSYRGTWIPLHPKYVTANTGRWVDCKKKNKIKKRGAHRGNIAKHCAEMNPTVRWHIKLHKAGKMSAVQPRGEEHHLYQNLRFALNLSPFFPSRPWEAMEKEINLDNQRRDRTSCTQSYLFCVGKNKKKLIVSSPLPKSENTSANNITSVRAGMSHRTTGCWLRDNNNLSGADWQQRCEPNTQGSRCAHSSLEVTPSTSVPKGHIERRRHRRHRYSNHWQQCEKTKRWRPFWTLTVTKIGMKSTINAI